MLVFTRANLTDIAIASCLAFRVHAPLMPVKVVYCTKAFASSTVFDIAFEWFLVTLVMLPMLLGISPGGPTENIDWVGLDKLQL